MARQGAAKSVQASRVFVIKITYEKYEISRTWYITHNNNKPNEDVDDLLEDNKPYRNLRETNITDIDRRKSSNSKNIIDVTKLRLRNADRKKI